MMRKAISLLEELINEFAEYTVFEKSVEKHLKTIND